MRLFEAILDANHRALAGDPSAGLHVADFADSLPVVALTCIDPRLSRLFPGVLGLPEEQFIWLRNSGNIIASPHSTTLGSIALACVAKGGREIAVIGHTDCKVRRTTVSELTERFQALGIERRQLPEDLADYFGLFASERQNVIRGVDFMRQCPLIGPRIPVHGLVVDVLSGQLEWIVNGYESLERPAAANMRLPALGEVVGDLATGAGFNFGEMKFPESKIGEIATAAIQAPSPANREAAPQSPIGLPSAAPPPPPVLRSPLPPPPARARAVPIPPPIRLNPGDRDKKR